MRRPLLALLALLIVFVPIISGCRPSAELTNEQRYRMELLKEIKAFERRLGFGETENFKIYSAETEAYDYYFYTSSTELPHSLDDPPLQFGTGPSENVSIDLEAYDVFFYSIQALAGVETPVTRSLIEAPLPRFIHVVFHEDWHEQIDLPLGIEEPSGEVVSHAAAMLFAEEKFGQDSEVYDALRRQLNNKLRESEVYENYYQQLEDVYSRFHAGAISESETLRNKEQLLKSMEDELQRIWGAAPDQLNNAFIAFQMTYYRYLPLLYRVFSATDSDLIETIAIFRAMPEQEADFDSLERIISVEGQVADYLNDSLQKIGQSSTGRKGEAMLPYAYQLSGCPL